MGLRAAAAAVAAVAVTGCAGGPSAGTGTAVVPGSVHLDEKANGRTVSVDFGQSVIVTLHSSYWRIEIPSRALQPVGEPQLAPGTVSQTFNAAKVGTTTIHAHRNSCGEALRCTGNDGDWSVTVRVR